MCYYSSKEELITKQNTATQIYKNSEWHFKVILWSYIILGTGCLLAADYVYVMFSLVLIGLIFYGEKKRQQCRRLKTEIKTLRIAITSQLGDTNADVQTKEQ